MNESLRLSASSVSYYATPEPSEDRHRLSVPIIARFGTTEVLILEIGKDGVVIEHYREFPTSGPRTLSFVLSGMALVLEGRVLNWKSRSFRNGSGQAVFRSEIEFLQRVGPAFNQLVTAIDRYESHLREIHEANVQGIHVPEWVNEVVSRRGLLCVSFRFRDGRWDRELTTRRTQPEDGFTVNEHETESELRLLMRSYEKGDEPARVLIRHFAALSLLPPG
ncbi:MAG TPA: hypothetical protein VIL97_08255 [Thermoanaerobaculia bacterium]